MLVKIANVEVDKVKEPREWDNVTKKYVQPDPYESFLRKYTDKYVVDNIGGGVAYHDNYLCYLEKCWADHQVAVVTPDIFWNMILCELAQVVVKSPEKYRALFTDSDDKKEIVVYTSDPYVIPLDSIIGELKRLVPTNVDEFLPTFSTSTIRSTFAQYAAFADMCSPYYNYSMFCCAIPAIDVRGTSEDWYKIVDHIETLRQYFPDLSAYFKIIHTLFTAIAIDSSKLYVWENMFNLEKCGSGSQVEVVGWITKLFVERPKLAYSRNFSTHISKVKYKNLNTDKKYTMSQGLFFSNLIDGILVPEFGYIVNEC